jgi:electron transport complex protein RnfE
MSDTSYRKIITDGFWSNNPGLVQLLGLCPLLATSTTFINGLGLGLATTLTVIASNVTVSLVRDLVRPEVRIPVFVLVIASVVTCIELSMNAWFHELYNILGIFIPLIVTNCFVIGRAEAFASKHNVPSAALDGLTNGLGFTCVLITLGAMRELLGRGTLFDGAQMMFGPAAEALKITVIPDYHGFLLAVLPPGAFFGLAILLALKNVIDRRMAARVVAPVGVAATSAG